MFKLITYEKLTFSLYLIATYSTTLHYFIGNDPFVSESLGFPGVFLAAWIVNFIAHSIGYIAVFSVFYHNTLKVMFILLLLLCKVLNASLITW